MARVYLSFGSNQGDRMQCLEQALGSLFSEGIVVEKTSRIYESEAWGKKDDPPYLNCCARVSTGKGAYDLLRTLKSVEEKLGRVPRPRWAGREIDIDILFYEGITIKSPLLTIPHEKIPQRRFVLVALSEIDTNNELICDGKNLKTLLNEVKDPGWVNLYDCARYPE